VTIAVSRFAALAGFGVTLMAAVAAAPWACAAEFSLTSGDKAVGQIQEHVVRQGEVLADIARQYDIGYTEILAANPGINPWVPPAGRKLLIPTLYVLPDAPRQGIVLNLGDRRLYYFPPGGGRVGTFPIGIGATGFDTPHSTTRVVAKVADPTWVPPPSIRAEQPDLPAAIGPGPDNPLGAYEFRLGWKNYLIHGTNKPDGIGRNVSHGCIHLYPEDIEKLFGEVAVGTPVRVIEQEASAAWVGDVLYLEVHPDKDQADEIDIQQPMTPRQPQGLRELVNAAAGDAAPPVDWGAVDRAGRERSGLPVIVARRGGALLAGTGSRDAAATRAPIPLWPGTPPPKAARAPEPIFRTLPPSLAGTGIASGAPVPLYPNAQGPQDAAMSGAAELANDDGEPPLRGARGVYRAPLPGDEADLPAWNRPTRW
jgi:L,D-transpeptidase ErfK/SrfK